MRSRLFAALVILALTRVPIAAAGSVGFAYCGYIGGSETDYALAIAVDAAGSAYVAGQTSSDETSFPVTIGPDLTYNFGDVFVAKVKADGSGFIYAGYIGGYWGYGIAVDAGKNAYVAGSTDPITGAFPATVGPDLTYNGGDADAFVAKVKADGTGLVYAGYIGGDADDRAYHIAVDAVGSAYVVGSTESHENTFPVTVGPDLTHNGPLFDAFVAKVMADGTGLDYAGYIGGTKNDTEGTGIAVDALGSAYVVGYTDSDETSFPVISGPDLTFNGPAGGLDAFVAKVKADGSGLDYAGYVGGISSDDGNGIAVDSAGHAYLTGDAVSDQATFPVTVGPDLSYNGGSRDALVAKVKADGTALDYAGYIGGDQSDEGLGIAVDNSGNAYVTGNTHSTEATFPVKDGPDLSFNNPTDPSAPDAFVAMVRPDGAALVYAGYIGGDDDDFGYGIAVDGAGNAYVSGVADSTEATFPVTVGPDLTFNGPYFGGGEHGHDAFVAKIGPARCATTAAPVTQLKAVKQPAKLDNIGFTWFPDPLATGYNIWYVTQKQDIPLANEANQPPASPTLGCADPTPAPGPTCTDTGGVSRGAPTIFFYQVHSICAAGQEGP